jgi:hypothetical protein
MKEKLPNTGPPVASCLSYYTVFGEHDESHETRSRVCIFSRLQIPVSKFVQYQGVVHLQATERVLQYLC